jgi:hypothetical protein
MNMKDGKAIGLAISQGSLCGHFQPVEEERPKIPHIKQGLALTDLGIHRARINGIIAQTRYSPKEGYTEFSNLQTYT